MDPIGGFLLISSIGASNAANLPRSTAVFGVVLFLDLAYIIALILMLAYTTIMGKTDYQKIWEARFPSRIGDEADDDSKTFSNESRLAFEESLLRRPLSLFTNRSKNSAGEYVRSDPELSSMPRLKF
jgi:hypothetical protein